jgi:hypothetical protein
MADNLSAAHASAKSIVPINVIDDLYGVIHDPAARIMP